MSDGVTALTSSARSRAIAGPSGFPGPPGLPFVNRPRPSRPRPSPPFVDGGTFATSAPHPLNPLTSASIAARDGSGSMSHARTIRAKSGRSRSRNAQQSAQTRSGDCSKSFRGLSLGVECDRFSKPARSATPAPLPFTAKPFHSVGHLLSSHSIAKAPEASRQRRTRRSRPLLATRHSGGPQRCVRHAARSFDGLFTADRRQPLSRHGPGRRCGSGAPVRAFVHAEA